MTEIETLPQSVESKVLTASEIRANAALIQQVIQAVMKKDVHYGLVPGCGDKPTLLKPGSEKILSTFRIAVDPQVFDLSSQDEARYRVTARGIHQTSGLFLGSGVGEASSNEEKYKWRFAVCEAEWEATPEDRRREKYKRDGTKIKQIRTNPADVANTILKMAKKRAQIDLTLTVTAASDIFAQDLEDLEDEVRESVIAKNTTPAPEPPKRASEVKPTLKANEDIFIPAEIKVLKQGEGVNGPWVLWGIMKDKNTCYVTFNEKFAEEARICSETKKQASILYERQEKGGRISLLVKSIGEVAGAKV